jgi:hypothetical protein
MDKRLLFPALAMTAVAQTTSPANARVEKAVRARAEQFYKLELNKQFRQAETMVADESRDYFYDSSKPNFKDVKVGNVEITDKGKKALVHVMVSVEIAIPGLGAPQVFTTPSTSNWKLEKGRWCWYFDKEATVPTPFGKMKFGDAKAGTGIMDITRKTSATSIEALVTVDRRSVTLTAQHPMETVTLSNNLPGEISAELDNRKINGISAQLEGKTVKAGEKAILRIQRTSDVKAHGTVVLRVSPLNQEFAIKVTSE